MGLPEWAIVSTAVRAEAVSSREPDQHHETSHGRGVYPRCIRDGPARS